VLNGRVLGKWLYSSGERVEPEALPRREYEVVSRGKDRTSRIGVL
jgi:hypothetical protein